MKQNKSKELAFFNSLAQEQDYNVFTDEANAKIVDTILQCLKLSAGSIVDLGCGSGVFSRLLMARGYGCIGVDLSHSLLCRGKQENVAIDFLQADVEALPFVDNSLDAVVLSCLLHHLPDPRQCLRELHRVLKPGGRFVAFDPNRFNPFMYLYRDRSSPFYSAKGVTENERPVLPYAIRKQCQEIGLSCGSSYVDGLSYRYVASDRAKGLLPVYNLIDRYFFKPRWLALLRAFVFSFGEKICL